MSDGRIVVLGVPYDEQSSYRRGAAKAPTLIREAWFSPSSNLYSENGTLVNRELVKDLGDLEFPRTGDAFRTIERRADEMLEHGYRPVFLGGDHSITYPIMKAFSRHTRPAILQIDAHPDIYDSFEGRRLSHACPFARIMEEGLAERLVQLGIRTLTESQRGQAKKFGVEVHDMASLSENIAAGILGPLYVSLDIDALDPAFAPGVSHREPGGMSTRQVIRIIHSIKADIVGADIVEYNPDADISGMTGMVCAKLFKEIVSKMVH